MRTLFCFALLCLTRLPSLWTAAKQLADMSKRHNIAPWKELDIKKAELEAVIAKLKASR